MSGLSNIPPLPPYQPDWPDFQVWWQLAKQAIEAEIGGVVAAAEALAAAEASAHPKGVWSATADYALNDMVYYGGTFYISNLAHTALATAPPDDATNWTKYSPESLDDLQDGSTRRALATDTVVTGDITDNAVTNPTSAYSTGSVSVADTNTWTDIQSVTIAATGAPINVVAFFYAGDAEYPGSGGNQGGAKYQIIRDSTVVFGPVNMNAYLLAGVAKGAGPNVAAILDQPSAGSVTYKLQAKSSGGGAITPTFRSLLVMEAKK